MKKIILFISILFLLAGCTVQISNYKFVSNKNVDITKKYVLVEKDVSANSSQLVIVFFYYDVADISYYSALGKCLEKYDAQVMTDCKVTITSYFFLIGGYTEYGVEGDVWRMVNEGELGAYDPKDIFELTEENNMQFLVNSNGFKHKIDYNNQKI